MKRYIPLCFMLFFGATINATFWLDTRIISMNISGNAYFPGAVYTTFSFDLADTAALASSPDASLVCNLFGDASDGGCLVIRTTKLMNIKTNAWTSTSLLSTKGDSFLFFGRGALDYRSNLAAVDNTRTMVLFPAPKAYSTDFCGFGGAAGPTSTDVAWGMTSNYNGTPTVLTTPSNNDPTGGSPGIEVVNPNEQHYMSCLDASGNAVAAFSGQDKRVYVNEYTSGSWNGQSVARYTVTDATDSVRCGLDNNGNAFVIFATSSDGTNRTGIKALYRNGATWGSATSLVTAGPGTLQSDPFLAVDKTSGNAFALYQSGGKISARLFDGSWKGLDVISSGNLDTTNYRTEPIAMNNNGQAYAVWVSNQTLMGSFYNGGRWELPLQISDPAHIVLASTISVSMDDMGNAVAVYQDNSSMVPYSALYIRNTPPVGQWLVPRALPISNTNLARVRMNNNSDALVGVVFSGNSNFFATVNKKLSNQITLRNLTQVFANVSFTKDLDNTDVTPQCTTVENSVPFTLQSNLNNRFPTQGEDFNVLRWELVPGATAYRILRNGFLIESLGPDTTLYVDHNRPSTAVDTYIVIAVDAQGSIQCNVLTWDAVDKATSYVICKDGMEIDTVDASTTTYQDCNVQDDQSCESFTYLVKAQVPFQDQVITLSWDPVDGAQCYRVYRTMQDGITNPKDSANICCLLKETSQTSYVDSSPDPTCPGYTVVAVDENGCEVKNVVNWIASTDSGIAHYNIYKDGIAIAQVPAASGNLSYTDPGSPSEAQTYIITAACTEVNTTLNENIEALPLQGGQLSVACSTDPAAASC